MWNAITNVGCGIINLFRLQGLRIQDLQQERIHLHRDIRTMARELGVSLETLKNHEIAEGVRLFPVDPNSANYPGDTDILGDFSLPLSQIKP